MSEESPSQPRIAVSLDFRDYARLHRNVNAKNRMFLQGEELRLRTCLQVKQ